MLSETGRSATPKGSNRRWLSPLPARLLCHRSSSIYRRHPLPPRTVLSSATLAYPTSDIRNTLTQHTNHYTYCAIAAYHATSPTTQRIVANMQLLALLLAALATSIDKIPLCVDEILCNFDHCERLYPICTMVSRMSVLFDVSNGSYFQPLSDEKVFWKAPWTREPSQSKRWVTKPRSNDSLCQHPFVAWSLIRPPNPSTTSSNRSASLRQTTPPSSFRLSASCFSARMTRPTSTTSSRTGHHMVAWLLEVSMKLCMLPVPSLTLDRGVWI